MGVISFAIIKLTLIVLLGYLLYKVKMVKEEIVDFLTSFIFYVSAPCMMFSYLLENSWLVKSRSLWSFLGLSVIIFLLGYIIGLVYCLARKAAFKKEVIGLVSLQNAGYLPLSMATLLFFGRMREEFIVYTILYLLGYNVFLWSVGSAYIYKGGFKGLNLKNIFTPIILAIILGLIMVYARAIRYLPNAVLNIFLPPIKMIGDTTFVLAMILLGAWLAKTNLKGIKNNLRVLIETSILKLVVVPAIILIFLVAFKQFSFFGLFALVQAAMPSAASLPIITKMNSADSEFTAQGVFLSHLLAIVSVGIWIQIYIKVSAAFLG